MKRIAIVLAVGIFFSLSCLAQDTETIVGTVVDSPDGIPWVGGTWSAQFYNPRGGNATYIDNGQPVTPLQYPPTLITTGGAFTIFNFPMNNAIAPAGTMWTFTFCPNAVTGCVTLPPIAITQAGDITPQISNFIKSPRFPANGANQFGYSDLEISPAPVPGGFYYNVTTPCQRVWNGSGFACQGSGGGGGSGVTGAWIDVNQTLHCDPTGAADCTPALTASMIANPTATFMFGVPAGSTSATYLLAAAGNLTTPSGVTFQIQNGAMLSTGRQASVNISSMNHMSYANGAPNYSGQESINLSGCTSASSGTTITFTNCPGNTINAFFTPIFLTGLTHVANCYFGCYVSSVASATSFQVFNANSTGTITAGPETGQIVKADHVQDMQLGGIAQSFVNNGTIILNVANNIPFSGPSSAVGNVIQLIGTTNVPASTFLILGGTAGQITLSCLTCVNNSPAPETGRLLFYPGGLTNLNLASALPGGPTAVGWVSPQGRFNSGSGRIVCTGTGTDLDGPYWITSTVNTSTYGLLDPRGAMPSVTTGSCYVPYLLTVQGSIIASPAQQIVANGSAVYVQGNTSVYVGWYGAKGAVLSTDDYLGFQQALFWNPARRVSAPRLSSATYGFDVASATDYNLGSSVTLYGNSAWFDGEMGTLWAGGTTVQCNMTTSPCVILRPDTASVSLTNFEFNGTGGGCVAGSAPDLVPYLTWVGQDAVAIGGGEARLDQVKPRCFARNGIELASVGIFNNLIYGAPQPDYWRVGNVFSDGNGAYGFLCIGADCNGGSLNGTNNADGNWYGGWFDQSQEAGTYNQANGEGNNAAFLGGTTTPITSLTVSGSGYFATCTVSPAPLPTSSGNPWIIIAGTGVADGTWNNRGSATFSCPGSSGSATTGTFQFADSNSIYTAIQQYQSGNHGNTFTIAGVLSTNQVAINPYSESTNGCITGAGLVIGGTIGQYLYQDGGPHNCGTAATHTYGKGFNGAWIGSQAGGLGIYSNFGVLIRSIQSTVNRADLMLNAPWNGGGTAFAGEAKFQWSSATDQNFIDWLMGVGNGNIFTLHEQISGVGDGADILEVESSAQGNHTKIAAPSTTGSVLLGGGATSVSPVLATSCGLIPSGMYSFTGDGAVTFCLAGAWVRRSMPIPASLTTTTAGASDVVTMTGVTATSRCTFAATNALAATNIASTYVLSKTTNSITVEHTSVPGMTYDILCTVN